MCVLVGLVVSSCGYAVVVSLLCAYSDGRASLVDGLGGGGEMALLVGVVCSDLFYFHKPIGSKP